jgi:hypothetical protein
VRCSSHDSSRLKLSINELEILLQAEMVFNLAHEVCENRTQLLPSGTKGPCSTAVARCEDDDSCYLVASSDAMSREDVEVSSGQGALPATVARSFQAAVMRPNAPRREISILFYEIDDLGVKC